jgi:hypothetical protein
MVPGLGRADYPAAVEFQWRLFSLTLRYSRWIMVAVGVGLIALALLWIAPPGRIMDEYRAAHGISGVVHVDSCSSRSRGARSSARHWFCTGSFTGEGISIPSVEFVVDQDEAPTDEWAMVASADATHAYPPGNPYGGEVISGVLAVALGSLLLYWAFGGRLWRRDGAW